ncbi:MAG: cupin domain-containing protein [Oscillospiraceae bacterium]|nr:cupin domain-containing protein [Oscillospiraceae bacterium]
MEIIVKKPTEEEKAAMRARPTWGCGVSTFDWYYDSEEHCLLIEGEVTVSYDGGSASFGAGDYVILPKGMSCVWNVTKPVKKYYQFRAC